MKTYTYDRRSFFIEVTFTGYLCIAIVFLCLYLAYRQIAPGLMLFASVIAGYTIWNTFISHSTPEVVTITEDAISFSAFQKENRYQLSEIKQLRIRELPSSGKMYIRINDATMLHGRYWIQTKQFEHGSELFRTLLDLEYAMHPDTLKARARTVNTKYRNVSARGTGQKRKAGHTKRKQTES